MTDEQILRLRESIRHQTDEEFDAVWAEMVKDGIVDADGNVLKRIPEPPDWLTGRNGTPKNGEPTKPAKKARRSRKRA